MPTMHYSKHMLPLNLCQSLYTMTEPFPKSVLLHFLQSSIYTTLQPITSVYMRLIFIISMCANWNTKGLHFQFPLCLLCQLTELCHIFMSLILSSSIPGIMTMYDPLALDFKFFSCIPLLYVQTCYMHNILHFSYSSYISQWLCDQTYCKKNNIP